MKNIYIILLGLLVFTECTVEDGVSESSISGSYATLLVVNDFMYGVNDQELATFDLKNDKDPILIDLQDVGFGIENIYHIDGILFIGSTTTLHIYEIQSSGIPISRSETAYFDGSMTSCDPVISDGDFAYVTLATTLSGPCARWVQINELRIYNVENIEEPTLLSVTEMEFPKGLAIDGEHLFVCEGNSGLKVFDVTNRENPIEIEFIEGFETFDVIAKDGLLMVTNKSEIRQYDYSDINNIIYLSSIDL